MVMLPKVGVPAANILAASGAAGNKAWCSQANFAASKILF
jgi:hypothetical protein